MKLDWFRSVYMMLIHESHVFELQVEMKFEVWDSCSFFSVKKLQGSLASNFD